MIDGTGSYGAVLTEQLATVGFLIAEAPGIPAHVRRAAGKTDTLDAVEIARAARGLIPQQLRWPRHAGDRTMLRVLISARDQMTSERTRTVNALTALLRTVELDIDARRALPAATIATVTAWRTPTSTATPATTRAVCRAEAIRLARRIHALDAKLTANHAALAQAVTAQAPELLELRGVGPRRGRNRAAGVVTPRTHPLRSPLHHPRRGLTTPGILGQHPHRHRLNRSGDRRLNRAIYTATLTRLGHDHRTREYFARRTAEGRTRRKIIRSLKRYISRELFGLLAATQPRPSTA